MKRTNEKPRPSDTAEAAELLDALEALEASEAGHATDAEMDRLRRQVVRASRALERKQTLPGSSPDVDSRATHWERIQWPDYDPLPEAGHRMTIGTSADANVTVRHVLILAAQRDAEPGWIKIEVRSGK